jgi:hypothetical protein
MSISISKRPGLPWSFDFAELRSIRKSTGLRSQEFALSVLLQSALSA